MGSYRRLVLPLVMSAPLSSAFLGTERLWVRLNCLCLRTSWATLEIKTGQVRVGLVESLAALVEVVPVDTLLFLVVPEHKGVTIGMVAVETALDVASLLPDDVVVSAGAVREVVVGPGLVGVVLPLGMHGHVHALVAPSS